MKHSPFWLGQNNIDVVYCIMVLNWLLDEPVNRKWWRNIGAKVSSFEWVDSKFLYEYHHEIIFMYKYHEILFLYKYQHEMLFLYKYPREILFLHWYHRKIPFMYKSHQKIIFLYEYHREILFLYKSHCEILFLCKYLICSIINISCFCCKGLFPFIQFCLVCLVHLCPDKTCKLKFGT